MDGWGTASRASAVQNVVDADGLPPTLAPFDSTNALPRPGGTHCGACTPSLSPVQLITLARTPVVETVCKDGRSAQTFVGFFEVYSIDSVLRTARVRFVHHLAETLGQFLGPHDVVLLHNFRLPAGKLADCEIQLGSVGLEGFKEKHQLPCRDAVTLLVKRGPGAFSTSPAILEFCDHDIHIHFQVLPPWAKRLPCQILPPSLQHNGLDDRLWDVCMQDQDIECLALDTNFSDIVYFQERAAINFFGTVVEVRLAPRALTLPEVREVTALNVTLIDPSVAATYRAGLLPANAFRYGILYNVFRFSLLTATAAVLNFACACFSRLSLMIVAQTPEMLPPITCGDVLRVLNAGFYVTQDAKSGAIYLNCRTNPMLTHISLWNIDALASFPPGSADVTQVVRPQWSSAMSGIASAQPAAASEVSAGVWERVTSLARWAAESMLERSCFTNEYATTLGQVVELVSWKHCDLLVCALSNVSQSLRQFQTALMNTAPSHSGRALQPLGHQTMFVANTSFAFSSNSAYSNRSYNSSVSDALFILHVDDFSRFCPPASTSEKRPTVLQLRHLSKVFSQYLSHHIRQGDWLLLKNVLFTKLYPGAAPVGSGFDAKRSKFPDIYEFDASRCRVVKIPPFAKEVQQRRNINVT